MKYFLKNINIIKTNPLAITIVFILTALSCSNIISETMEGKITEPVDLTKELTAHLLDEPKNYVNGSGIFTYSPPLTDNLGDALLEGVDFDYGVPINGGPYDIFDTLPTGSLAEGRYIRIVESGLNITAVGGLQLVPRAMNLSSLVLSPPYNECYIDPLLARFVMPRPSYWSRCEDPSDIADSPAIKENDPVVIYDGTQNDFPGKFGNGLQTFYSLYSSGQSMLLSPLGNGTAMHSGTISLWFRFSTVLTRYFEVYLCGSSNRIYVDANDFRIYINNLLIDSGSFSTVTEWTHLYIVFDKDGMPGGDTVRAFFDGGNEISATDTWLDDDVLMIRAYGSTVYFDNIKIWKEVVSEDPAWEYNGGLGREDALHPIYGEANGYKPVLTGTGNGVGFYCIE